MEVPQPLVLFDGPLGAPQPSAFSDVLFDRFDTSVDEFPQPAFFGSVVDPHPPDPLSLVDSVGFPQPALFFDASDRPESAEFPQPPGLLEGPLEAPQPSALLDVLLDLDRFDSAVLPQPPAELLFVAPQPSEEIFCEESSFADVFPQPPSELLFDEPHVSVFGAEDCLADVFPQPSVTGPGFPHPEFFGSVVEPHPPDPLSPESVGFPQPADEVLAGPARWALS